VYGVYFLRAGEYDVVGFRLAVQTVFDGLVAAIAASGMNLGGLTPSDGSTRRARISARKSMVRKDTDSWPLVGDHAFHGPPPGAEKIWRHSRWMWLFHLRIQTSFGKTLLWEMSSSSCVFRGEFDDRWGAHSFRSERICRRRKCNVSGRPEAKLCPMVPRRPDQRLQPVSEKSLHGTIGQSFASGRPDTVALRRAANSL